MNEKVNKVIDVVLKVVSLVQIIAQAVKAVFPVEQKVVQQQALNLPKEEEVVVKDFLSGGLH